MTDLDAIRIQIVKALIDEFPVVRKFVKDYIRVYHR